MNNSSDCGKKRTAYKSNPTRRYKEREHPVIWHLHHYLHIQLQTRYLKHLPFHWAGRNLAGSCRVHPIPPSETSILPFFVITIFFPAMTLHGFFAQIRKYMYSTTVTEKLERLRRSYRDCLHDYQACSSS